MRKIAFLVTAALVFGFAPAQRALGPVAGSLALVGLAVLCAVAASGSAASLAVAGGALGALAAGVLGPTSPAAAGAALAGLCFAERTLRVRDPKARLLHAGGALVGGALAGSLATSFAASSLAVRGVALVVAAVLAALPLLVDADHPLAHARDGAASEVDGPARAALREGAELRRAVDDELLDRAAARQVERTWASLLRLAEARIRLERTAAARRGAEPAGPSHAAAVIGRIDERIEAHVKALARAYAAVDTARAAEASLDDAALRGVENVGESLEQVSKAIVEEV
jgi:hypothetical protein